LERLNWRYATKQFDPHRKISPEDWAALESALVLSPSSFGLQPWKFIVVSDPALRERLVAVSWGQRQVAEASHLVVFAAKNLAEQDMDAYLARIAEVRGVTVPSLASFRKMMTDSIIKGMDAAARKTWAERQVYLALGTFLTSAAVMGIDACPMEGIEPEKYDQFLGLAKQGLNTVVVATAGFRHPADKYASLKKVRFPKEQVKGNPNPLTIKNMNISQNKNRVLMSLFIAVFLLSLLATASLRAGTITVVALSSTGTDVATGINSTDSSTNHYLCCLCFGSGSGNVTVNGVPFLREKLSGALTLAGTDSNHGGSWTLTANHNLGSTSNGNASSQADGNTASLLSGPCYVTSSAPVNSWLEQTYGGLTPGAQYAFRLYYRQWVSELPQADTKHRL
jgi:nitroreductase